MGLRARNVRPTFRIVANDSDITEQISSRLVRMTIRDEAGYRSDECNITITNHDSGIELPEKGAELEVWIGYDDANVKMGVFVVDALNVKWPSKNIEIKAKASPQATGTPSGYVPLQTQLTRSWNAGTTLGDMTRRIAADHGLRAVVDADLEEIVLPHVDQVSESNINLLTRLSRSYDGVAKAAAGNLVLAKRGESRTATGEDIPPVILVGTDLTTADADISGRFNAGTVVATYRDPDAAADVAEEVGSGEPRRELRHQFSSREEAQAAAAAELRRGQRGERKLSGSCPGDPDLQAEGTLVILDTTPGVDGVWGISSVTHTISNSGYVCDFECENTQRGGGGGRGNSGQEAREWLAREYPGLYDTLTEIGDPLRRDTQAREWFSETYPEFYDTLTDEE